MSAEAETKPTPAEAPSAPAPAAQSAAPGPSASGGAPNSFTSASLYVGDLLPEVNEGLLYEIFNAVGPVASIRVCRDAVTRRSLGYAYVNYHQAADAERALDSMNFTDIKGKPCRIMWSQRDPSVRRSGVGNIFVKNLHEGIDNKQLYDTFSLFGNILSCKVVCDRETGLSKGYGYVHYETNEAAASAIDKLDGMLIDGKEVQVGVFMRRDTRPDQEVYTNLFIKNMPYEWDDKRLEAEFAEFGEIVSASVKMGKRKKFAKKGKKAEAKKDEDDKEDGAEDKPAEEEKPEEEAKPAEEEAKPESTEPESLGFGFVNFATHEAAAAAVEAMNDKVYKVTEDGDEVEKALFVGRAQKKSERQAELRSKYEAEKMERIAKFQGVNLYVKNLDDAVTDDMLRDEFGGMGTITSAKIMRDAKTNNSRGFGFVCFSTPEDATRAVNEMSGKIVAGKPIYVSLAQRREVRRAQLEAQHAGGRGGGPGGPGMMRGGPMGGPPMGGGYPGQVPMYMPRPGPGMQPSYPMGGPMMGGRGGYPGRGGMQPMQPGYGMMGGRGGPGGRGQPGPYGRGPGRGAPYGRGRGPMGPGPGRGGMPGQPPVQFHGGVRNAGMPPGPGGPMPGGPGDVPQGPPPPQQQQQEAPPSANEQLTPAALASATPEIQKNMIGERLYPLIHQTQPDLAGKITGMLLEMDNSELLHLLESPEALGAKIQEALQVLDAHNAADK